MQDNIIVKRTLAIVLAFTLFAIMALNQFPKRYADPEENIAEENQFTDSVMEESETGAESAEDTGTDDSEEIIELETSNEFQTEETGEEQRVSDDTIMDSMSSADTESKNIEDDSVEISSDTDIVDNADEVFAIESENHQTNLVTRQCCWQDLTDEDFSDWILNGEEEQYIRDLLCRPDSEEYILFFDRIYSLQDDKVVGYILSLCALLSEQSIINDQLCELTDSVEEITSDAESDLQQGFTENGEAFPTSFSWDEKSDEEFNLWIHSADNSEYILDILKSDDTDSPSNESTEFHKRVDMVSDETQKYEINQYLDQLLSMSNHTSTFMMTGTQLNQYEFLKTEAEAVEFIENHLIARETYFELYYEYPGIVSTELELFTIATNLKGIATGNYIDSYSENGDGNDYLAFQLKGFLIKGSIKETTVSTTKIVFSCTAHYYTTADEEQLVRDTAEALLNRLGVNGMSSRYDKVWSIYDWITSNVSYGECKDNPEDHPYTAYGALIEHKAVCQGYSNLMYKLLNDSGIPCRIMVSANHAWNVVEMDDGNWYIIDSANGTTGKTHYFLIGTDTYSRYERPIDSYMSIWSTLSTQDYGAVHAPSTGIIATNVKWTVDGSTLILEPADPTQYSSFTFTDGQSEMIPYYDTSLYTIETTIIRNINDYGGISLYEWVPSIRPVGSTIIHQGNIPSSPHIYNGMSDNNTTYIFPCSWKETDDFYKFFGFCDYADDKKGYVSLYEHTEVNPDGPRIVFEHEYRETKHTSTCTEPGGAVLICICCGDIKESEVSVPALGHDYREVSRTPATCVKNGEIIYECSRCHDGKNEILPATDHRWEQIDTKAAICLEDGKTTYMCSSCNTVRTETIKSKGHTEGTPYVKEEATCEKEGIEVTECIICHIILKTERINKLEHVWSEIGRTDATCTENGIVKYSCTLCKATKEETLISLKHDPEPMPATDKTTGGIWCRRCHEILEEPTFGIQICLNGISSGDTVYIDGYPYTACGNDLVIIPAAIKSCSVATTYTYGSGSGGSYPTGMKVWMLKQDDQSGTVIAERTPYFDNLLTYSGTSIRIKGNQGIAIHTTLNTEIWQSLTGSGYNGYTVEEAGLLVTKIFENDLPVYDGAGVIKGKSFAGDGSVRSINNQGNSSYYMNTVVFGGDMEKTKWDLACRPYMIIKDHQGNASVIYGGILVRSVRSVAQQIQETYANDKEISAFLKKILDA